MKRIIWSCVALVFGALVIFGAILELNSDRVECGGETMTQGDICVSKTRGGRVTESNLEESKTSAKVGAIAGIVISSLIILIGFQNLKIGIRNRKAAAEAVPSIPWPDVPFPPHQQYPPEQQNPQQHHQFLAQPEYAPSPQLYSPSPQGLEYQQNQPIQHSPQQSYTPPQQHYYSPQPVAQPHDCNGGQYLQGTPQQQQQSPQRNQSPQYPPQQHYYQPPQHQYYPQQQQPGPGDAQR